MKNLSFTIIAFFIISVSGMAQVGIGIASPDASALLQVESTNKGLLIPRVTTTDLVTSPANGLLVYQTGGTPGFYFNKGTSASPNWTLLMSSATGGITNADVSATAAIVYSKLLLSNSILNGDLTANSVTTSKVANGTVTTSKMADSAITGLKLLTAAVNTRHVSLLGSSLGQTIINNGSPYPVWGNPTAAVPAIAVFDASSCSPCNFTLSDLTARTIIIDASTTAAGRSMTGVTINLTVPAAASYPDGVELSIGVNNYAAIPTALNIISPNSTIATLNTASANANGASGVPIVSTGGRIVSKGTSSKWYRLVN